MAAFALSELLPNKWRHIGVVLADAAVLVAVIVEIASDDGGRTRRRCGCARRRRRKSDARWRRARCGFRRESTIAIPSQYCDRAIRLVCDSQIEMAAIFCVEGCNRNGNWALTCVVIGSWKRNAAAEESLRERRRV